jgi:hypothetical protein
MTRFIETKNGYINLAHVGKITQWQRGDEYFSRLHAPNGEELADTEDQLDEWEIRDFGAPIVPAPAGYSIVTVFLGDPPIVTEEPIIAFRMRETFPDPYTLDGKVEVNAGTQAIKCPDGKFRTPGPGWVNDSLEEFIEGCIKENAASNVVTLKGPASS